MTPTLFTNIDALVRFAKLRAQRGIYDGRADPRNMNLLFQCSHLYGITPDISARLIYSRDVGHHSSGWWKNPDYERCLHLSISFCENPTDRPIPYMHRQAEKIARAFFGGDASKCWVEPPYSPEGKHADVHHYRLFCDGAWQPFMPKGEVYSSMTTPPDWKSFSEIHGYKPSEEDAPWLRAASE